MQEASRNAREKMVTKTMRKEIVHDKITMYEFTALAFPCRVWNTGQGRAILNARGWTYWLIYFQAIKTKYV